MTRKIGNPDSKYTYCPEQLEKDIGDKKHQHEVFKDMIKQFILMDPSKMDLRYHDVIEALKELKHEHGL